MERGLYADCTIECERMPECPVCGHRKAPWGRSVPLGAYFCDRDCAAYHAEPKAGHLWPGELAQVIEDGSLRVD
jgi:hypothetical protein